MSPFDTWIPRHASSCLPFLLDAGVKGLLLLALALVLSGWLLRRRSAAARHMVLCLAAVGLLCIPLLSAALPALRVPILPPDNLPAPNAPRLQSGGLPAPSPSNAIPESSSPPLAPPSVVRPEPFPSTDVASPSVPPVASPDSNAPRLRSGGLPVPLPSLASAWTWSAALVALWAAGALLFLLHLVLGSLLAARRAALAVPLTDADSLALLKNLARRLGIRRAVRRRTDPRGLIPATSGLLRPTILLPTDAAAWPEQRRQIVLLHELAHVKRADCLTQLVTRLAWAFHWFNPLAWLAARQIRVDRENACDDLVLASGFKASDYAGHLLDIVSSLRTSAWPSPTSVSMARPSHLKARLLAILDARRPRRSLTRRGALAAAALILALTTALAVLHATTRPASAPAPADAATAATAPATQPASVPGQLTVTLSDGIVAVITPKPDTLAKYFRNDPAYFIRLMKQDCEGSLREYLEDVPVGVGFEMARSLEDLATIEYRGKPARPDLRARILQIAKAENQVHAVVREFFPAGSTTPAVEKVFGPGKEISRNSASGIIYMEYPLSSDRKVQAIFRKDGTLWDLFPSPDGQKEAYDPRVEARLAGGIESYVQTRRFAGEFLQKVNPGWTQAQADARMDQALRDGKTDPAAVQGLVARQTEADSPATTRPATGAADAVSARVVQWIGRLGAGSAPERDRAQQELLKIGEPAVELLTKAAADKDPERSTRAKLLLEEISKALVERLAERIRVELPPGWDMTRFQHHLAVPPGLSPGQAWIIELNRKGASDSDIRLGTGRIEVYVMDPGYDGHREQEGAGPPPYAASMHGMDRWHGRRVFFIGMEEAVKAALLATLNQALGEGGVAPLKNTQPQSVTTRPGEPLAEAEAVNGLRVSLTARPDVFLTGISGDGFGLWVTFTNASDKPIRLTRWMLGYTPLLTGPDGLPLTPVRKNRRADFAAPKETDVKSLAPGESVDVVVDGFPRFTQWNDEDHFDLSKPGPYRLRLAYKSKPYSAGLPAGFKECWQGTVVTNEVGIDVRDYNDKGPHPVDALRRRVLLGAQGCTQAEWAAGHLGADEKAGVPVLAALLAGTERWTVKVFAAHGLLREGSKASADLKRTAETFLLESLNSSYTDAGLFEPPMYFKPSDEALRWLTPRAADPTASPVLRRQAMRLLSQYGEGRRDEVRPVLRAGLGDKDPEIRRHAMNGLDNLGARPDELQLYKQAAADPDPAVRHKVFQMLAGKGWPEAMPVILAGLRSDDEEIRRACAWGICHFGDKSLAPELVRLLNERPHDVGGNFPPDCLAACHALAALYDLKGYKFGDEIPGQFNNAAARRECDRLLAWWASRPSTTPPEPSTTRPATDPDARLERLLKTAATHTEEGADALLQLRDRPDERATAALESILASLPKGSRNHDLAVQALFCVGTPQAHAILEKQGVPGPGEAIEAVDWTFGAKLKEPQRSRLIEQYLLRSLSKDLQVQVAVKPRGDADPGRIELGVTVRNVSDKPFHLHNRRYFLGELLHFRAKDGTYIRGMATCKIDPGGSDTWAAMKPGDSLEYPISLQVVPHPEGLVGTGDYVFGIDKPGQYEVLAVVEEPPLPPEELKHLKIAEAWSGRAVSKPVTVEIIAPAPATQPVSRPAPSASGLSARIIIPVESKLADGRFSQFDALLELSNGTDKPLRVCTYCYPSTSLERDRSSVNLAPDVWKSDAPRPSQQKEFVVTIDPGESVTIPFKASTQGEGPWTLRASYSVSRPEYIRELNLWSGYVESPPLRVNATKAGVVVLPSATGPAPATRPAGTLTMAINATQPADAPVILTAALINNSDRDMSDEFDQNIQFTAYLTGPDGTTRRVAVTNGSPIEGSSPSIPVLKPGQSVSTPLRLTNCTSGALLDYLPSEQVFLSPGAYRLRLTRQLPGPEHKAQVEATATFVVVKDAALAKARWDELRNLPAARKEFAEHVLTATLTPEIRRQWYSDIKEGKLAQASLKVYRLSVIKDPPADVAGGMIECLKAQLVKFDPTVRDQAFLLNNAASFLANRHPPGAGPVFLQLATGPYVSSADQGAVQFARKEAIYALQFYWRDEMADRVAPLLADKDKWIPLCAARLLAWAGDLRAVGPLVAGAREKNAYAAASLAYLPKNPAAAAALKEALASADQPFAKELRKAMGELPPARAATTRPATGPGR
ncbi:MAG: HEAT repeat domain-containing protein [Planctomycetota bacterium]|nr:HEAT repeat domain-containing protein [Planctomycetota bacterium]